MNSQDRQSILPRFGRFRIGAEDVVVMGTINPFLPEGVRSLLIKTGYSRCLLEKILFEWKTIGRVICVRKTLGIAC
ncbi:UNVERIFIED_CONTAM: hypothetical protein NCL1_57702 [Trichonephila clavipes]